MNMAGPKTSELVLNYVGKKNREITSALISAIWSGSWVISGIMVTVMFGYDFTFATIFLITSLLYAIGVILYYLLILDYNKNYPHLHTMHPIKQALQQRILIIDGAMGTMIQRHKLEEKDYRGTRFADWHSDIKGNNDLLSLTQPHIIAEIHRDESKVSLDFIVSYFTHKDRFASDEDFEIANL